MKKKIQKDRVLDWLVNVGPLTVREAMTELDINSLPARIMDLRRDGYPIIRTWKVTKNGTKYGVYELIGGIDE